MAIQSIKNIINNKGYIVNSKDRAIFEQGNLQSFFGFGETDAIEFIVYDVNNNQLPQMDGSLVRYINLTSENISDYFMIAEGTILTKHKLPNEYFIDVERLLSEAGYTNGIFKTQITLINKRVGSEKENDKMWISEISPSRTEIRLFPLKNEATKDTDLEKRFTLFVNDGQFRDDTINFAFNFIEKISPNTITDFMIKKYGNGWVDKMKTEFKIKDLDVFVTNIYNKFSEACFYNFTNRVSDLKDSNYGKPKKTKPQIELSIDQIKDICQKILIKVIDFYLNQQDIHSTATFDKVTLSSVDTVDKVLQSLQSDTVVSTSKPVTQAIVLQKPFQTEQEIHFENEVIKITDPQKPKPEILVPDDRPPYKPIEEPIGQPVLIGGGGSRGGGGGSSRFYLAKDGINMGDADINNRVQEYL